MPAAASNPLATHGADDACYLALKARDARFDGHFFTGVTSTGIYCRPVCRVRTPRRENCQFFALAAQAESAGFRPCLRCRPELAPASAGGSDALQPSWSTQDASFILARQAATLLDDLDVWSGDSTHDNTPCMGDVAAHLGVSERHLRRLFEAHWGVSPLQYRQTRRLLMAKRLLTDTTLSVAQVAGLSGFASVRRFNACFVAHYRLQPRQLRAARTPLRGTPPESAAIALKASYRPPYDVAAMLNFFGARQLDGVEAVDPQRRTLARTLGARLVERFGTDLATPVEGLRRLFPSPQALLQAPAEDLGQMGIVRQRQRAIQALAQAVLEGRVALQPGVPIAQTLATLQELPGIGPWTAQYIAMRALRWPDAFVAGDVALHNALGVRAAANPQRAAEEASQRWRPWRSYAVVRAWASLAAPLPP